MWLCMPTGYAHSDDAEGQKGHVINAEQSGSPRAGFLMDYHLSRMRQDVLFESMGILHLLGMAIAMVRLHCKRPMKHRHTNTAYTVPVKL